MSIRLWMMLSALRYSSGLVALLYPKPARHQTAIAVTEADGHREETHTVRVHASVTLPFPPLDGGELGHFRSIEISRDTTACS